MPALTYSKINDKKYKGKYEECKNHGFQGLSKNSSFLFFFFRFLRDIGELQPNFLEHPETNFALSTLAANKNGISPINNQDRWITVTQGLACYIFRNMLLLRLLQY